MAEMDMEKIADLVTKIGAAIEKEDSTRQEAAYALTYVLSTAIAQTEKDQETAIKSVDSISAGMKQFMEQHYAELGRDS